MNDDTSHCENGSCAPFGPHVVWEVLLPIRTLECHNNDVARIWIEERDGNFVPPQYRQPLPSKHAGKLIAQNIMNVTVASFTFQFTSLDQIRDYLAYYERKTRSSSVEPIGAADHWEVQRWFEKLPMYLLEEPKRQKVVNALKRARQLAEAGAFSS